jgi:biotin-dependent carboxylase-like uncharacterized protein
VLEVVQAGLLATVQDLGRPGLGHLGIPVSGATDRWSLVASSLLLGDEPGRPALEVTLGGTELVALETCFVALTGADLGATVDGRAAGTGTVHRLSGGSRLAFGGGAVGGAVGARAYVGLAGGIAVEPVLGAAATYLSGQLGGIDGRAVRSGDRLVPGRRGDLTGAGRSWPEIVARSPLARRGPLAVVAGPDLRRLPPGALEALCSDAWTVAPQSDRMGVRLTGRSIVHGAAIVSEPMLPGAIQLPPDGDPIALLPDHQTVGGYPVVAVVSQADLPRLGQLRPGDQVRFAPTTLEDARAALLEQLAALDAARAALSDAARWDDLANHARG